VPTRCATSGAWAGSKCRWCEPAQCTCSNKCYNECTHKHTYIHHCKSTKQQQKRQDKTRQEVRQNNMHATRARQIKARSESSKQPICCYIGFLYRPGVVSPSRLEQHATYTPHIHHIYTIYIPYIYHIDVCIYMHVIHTEASKHAHTDVAPCQTKPSSGLATPLCLHKEIHFLNMIRKFKQTNKETHSHNTNTNIICR
jgi:hypothetical protein